MDALDRYGPGAHLVPAGRRDLATHLYRTRRLGEGAPLSTVTAEIAAALGGRRAPAAHDRRPGARPGSTVAGRGRDRVPGVLRPPSPRRAGAGGAVRRRRAAARPGPGVLEALARRPTGGGLPRRTPSCRSARMLAVPGVRDAVVARRDDVVAVSPIVAGAALKGPADRLLAELGHESSVVGVARLYAAVGVGAWWSTRPTRRLAGGGGGRGRALRRRPRPSCGAARGGGRWPRAVLGARDGPAGDHPRRGRARGPSRRRAGRPAGRGRRVGLRATATSSSSPRRWCPRPRAGWCPSTPTTRQAHKALVEAESVRVLRRRGDLVITETRHGFVCANAGVDLSNVARGYAALLPVDSDRSARRIRDGLRARTGRRGGRDRVRHVRPAVAPGPHRRGHRLRRHRRRRRPAGHRPTPSAASCRSPRWRWPTSWPRPPSWSWARRPASPPPSSGASTRAWFREGGRSATRSSAPPAEDLFR